MKTQRCRDCKYKDVVNFLHSKTTFESANKKYSFGFESITFKPTNLIKMPAFLRMEIFPSDMPRTIAFYTNILRFELLRHEGTYAYFQRDGVFLGANTSLPEGSVPVNAKYRRPGTGVEIVIEVDDLVAERDFIVNNGYHLDADVKLQSWGLKDFRIVDPDGYYLRFTEHSWEKNGTGS